MLRIRKIIILFLIVISVPFTSYTQESPYLDSLRIAYRSELNLETKGEVMRKIYRHFYDGQLQFDSAYYYAQKIKKLGQKTGDKQLIFHSIYDQGCVWRAIKEYDSALVYFNKGVAFAKKNNLDASLARAYRDKGTVLYQVGDYEKAMSFYDKSLFLAQKLDLMKLQGRNNLQMGKVYLKKKEFEAAELHLKKAYELYDEHDQVFSEIVYALADLAFQKGDIKGSTAQANTALEMSVKENNPYLQYLSTNLLSKIATHNENFENAYTYKTEAAEIQVSLAESAKKNSVTAYYLKKKLKEQQLETAHFKDKSKYLWVIYVLVSLGVILGTLLVFRQLKVVKMTKEIRDVQERLIKTALDRREHRELS